MHVFIYVYFEYIHVFLEKQKKTIYIYIYILCIRFQAFQHIEVSSMRRGRPLSPGSQAAKLGSSELPTFFSMASLGKTADTKHVQETYTFKCN